MNPSVIDTSSAPLALPADTLHGIALRPPVLDWDGVHYHGSTLQHWDCTAAAALPGVVACVQQQHFVGLVATSAIHARQAAETVRPVWRKAHRPLAQATPSTADTTADSYVWQGSASHHDLLNAPVTVWVTAERLHVWLPQPDTPLLALLQQELPALLGQTSMQVCIAPHPQAPSRAQLPVLSVLDAAAEATLLSQHTQRAVSVHCRRLSHTLLTLRPATTDAAVSSSSAALSHLPTPRAEAPATPPGSTNAAPPTAWIADSLWVQRPSWARLLSQCMVRQHASPAYLQEAGTVQTAPGHLNSRDASSADYMAAQVFAHESLQCEQALQHGLDPIQTRVEHLPPGPGKTLAQQVLSQVQASAPLTAPAGWLQGRGFATATVRLDAEQSPAQQVWSAWVTDIAVSPDTGEIAVMRVLAGHDARELHPAHEALTHTQPIIDEERWLQHAQTLVSESSAFDHWALTTPTNPVHPDSTHLPQQAPTQALPVRHGALAMDGVVTLPAAAAIANAIQQATGVRLRQAPFDTERLRLAIAGQRSTNSARRVGKWAAWMTAGAASAMGLAYMALPAKPALPLTQGPDLSIYSPQALERGRLVAAAGDCVVCHTAPGGASNAGGLGLETPFGTIYSTNITPDMETGIGRWSYAAFERAMRQGIHQDGRQLYPAFPYTAFAKLSDTDLQALYGYLMTQPAVQASAPATELAFPYNLRPTLAGWNALFHDATPYQADPAHDAIWNRGAYLVNGVGHCGACHTPRNALGAEKTGLSYLAGGEAEGWHAPALNRLAQGERPWSAEELVQYLRTGYASQHGVAAGPMAPVIHGLAQLPPSDVEAIATYLLSLSPAPDTPAAPATVEQPSTTATALSSAPLVTTAAQSASMAPASAHIPAFSAPVQGARIFGNACAVCHEAGQGPTLFGVKPDLGVNTNVHADSPRNLLQTILHGVNAPADDSLGFMPGFADSLDDQQIVDLVHYLRSRFAPDAPAWSLDTDTVQLLRNSTLAGH